MFVVFLIIECRSLKLFRIDFKYGTLKIKIYCRYNTSLTSRSAFARRYLSTGSVTSAFACKYFASRGSLSAI